MSHDLSEQMALTSMEGTMFYLVFKLGIILNE